MPQLMPLNWIFSVMMMLVILMGVMLIYSMKEEMLELGYNVEMYNTKVDMWCW